MDNPAKHTGIDSERVKELRTAKNECYALIALAILCMIIGFFLLTLEVTVELLDSVSVDPASTLISPRAPITTHKEYTYMPYCMPGVYLIGLGIFIIIGSLLRLDYYDGRLWRIQSGLSEKKIRPPGARIPISETKLYGYLGGSAAAIGLGITGVVFGIFFWHHPMLEPITVPYRFSEYFLGYGMFYPFRDLAHFLNILGIVLFVIGLICLFLVIGVYLEWGSLKSLAKESERAD